MHGYHQKYVCSFWNVEFKETCRFYFVTTLLNHFIYTYDVWFKLCLFEGTLLFMYWECSNACPLIKSTAKPIPWTKDSFPSTPSERCCLQSSSVNISSLFLMKTETFGLGMDVRGIKSVSFTAIFAEHSILSICLPREFEMKDVAVVYLIESAVVLLLAVFLKNDVFFSLLSFLIHADHISKSYNAVAYQNCIFSPYVYISLLTLSLRILK